MTTRVHRQSVPVSRPTTEPVVVKAKLDAPKAPPDVLEKSVPVHQSPVEHGEPIVAVRSLGWTESAAPHFWMDQTLLKPPPKGNIALDDVDGGPLSPGVALPVIEAADDREAVFHKLAALPLGRMLVSPGYRYYRHPEDFTDVFRQVQTGNAVDTRPSILDVHTDGKGNVINVDLRSHHLRMAAFLESGTTTLGQLPFDQVLIKIDGQQRGDTYWPMKAHGYAVPPEVLQEQGVKLVKSDDPAQVEISNMQNYDLGSRTTLERFHQTLLHREQPKIGVIFGGDDLVARALALKAEKGLDEVVIAPGGKPDATLLEQVRNTEGLNVYLDAPASLRDAFPQIDYPTLVKLRLNLLYGVDVHAIVS